MFTGLIPGLNSVNSPEDELSGPIPGILISLLDLSKQFLLSEPYPAKTIVTLFTTHSLALIRQIGIPAEYHGLVLCIYFGIFIPVVLIALSRYAEAEEKYGGDSVGPLAGDVFFDADGDEGSLSFCGICFEEKHSWGMFRSESCPHFFCYDCTSKHIVAKIEDNMILIPCPEIGCKAVLDPDACRNIIPKDIIARWDECLCMSLIPEYQKVHCPFKYCSAMLVNDTGEVIGKTKCPACQRLICVQCRVPWHSEFTCEEFQRLNTGGEDWLVKELAKKKSWRKCPQCNFYVEKTEGCIHITCRCGYEFCYGCGSKWTTSHRGCSVGQEP